MNVIQVLIVCLLNFLHTSSVLFIRKEVVRNIPGKRGIITLMDHVRVKSDLGIHMKKVQSLSDIPESPFSPNMR